MVSLLSHQQCTIAALVVLLMLLLGLPSPLNPARAQEDPSPPFNPQVKGLRFYESSYVECRCDELPPDQRVYDQRFARETTRYINWKLNLEHPAPGRRVDFQITAVYYRANSANEWEEIDRQTMDT